jgi:hypothetical protein
MIENLKEDNRKSSFEIQCFDTRISTADKKGPTFYRRKFYFCSHTFIMTQYLRQI